LGFTHLGSIDLAVKVDWEHLIGDEGDFGHHVDYIHYNPVKHGLVARPMGWRRGSSIHRYIRLGRLSPDWAIVSDGGKFEAKQRINDLQAIEPPGQTRESKSLGYFGGIRINIGT
jgi:hypothetical protein